MDSYNLTPHGAIGGISPMEAELGLEEFRTQYPHPDKAQNDMFHPTLPRDEQLTRIYQALKKQAQASMKAWAKKHKVGLYVPGEVVC